MTLRSCLSETYLTRKETGLTETDLPSPGPLRLWSLVQMMGQIILKEEETRVGSVCHKPFNRKMSGFCARQKREGKKGTVTVDEVSFLQRGKSHVCTLSINYLHFSVARQSLGERWERQSCNV
jgi:hypothetical protein